MSACQFELKITGMHCAACSSRIERVVSKLPEVEAVSVSLPTNRAQVKIKDGIERSEAVKTVIARIEKIHFGAKLVENEDLVAAWEKENREAREALTKQYRRLWPMVAAAVVLLYISMGHMIGLPLPQLIDPAVSPLALP